MLEKGEWVTKHELQVDPAAPSEVKRLATKYMRKNIGIFNSKDRALNPETCFARVTADGTNTIHLHPKWYVTAESKRGKNKSKASTSEIAQFQDIS